VGRLRIEHVGVGDPGLQTRIADGPHMVCGLKNNTTYSFYLYPVGGGKLISFLALCGALAATAFGHQGTNL